MDDTQTLLLEQKFAEFQRVSTELKALQAQSGAMDVADYTLTGFDGQPVRLSEAFGAFDQMVLVHNMGFACKFCTLWADGFNGIWRHLESGEYGRKAKFLLLSNDTPEQQREGAAQRGWGFSMLSCRGTSLFADLGFTDETRKMWWPGVSTLAKDSGGRITRHARAEFGPGDLFCSLYHFFDLLPASS